MMYEVMWTACSQGGNCYRVVRDGYEYSVETIIGNMWERITDRTENFHDALNQMYNYIDKANKKIKSQLANWQG